MKLLEQKNKTADVITHDVAPLTVNTDARSYSRIGWLILVLGFGGFLLWALLAPLDKGVPMSGVVTKESNRKAIQHPSGGTIAEILVKDGDVVKAGQVLVRMNAVQASSQADISRAQYITARAVEARLKAERDGLKTIPFPEALVPYKADPRVNETIALQRELFEARQQSLRNELAAVDENIAGLKIQAKGLEESRESKKQQQEMLKEQLAGMRDLARDGYVARSRLLDLERTFAQLSGAISEDIGNIGRARSQVMELTLRRVQRLQDYQKEVGSQLSDAQRESEALSSRLRSLDYDLANVEVKSPVDGTVVGMSVFTRGGVVAPGFRMMEVVPLNDPLIAEGQLPVNLIDRVHTGLPVELMFSAFNTNKTPHIPGVLKQIAADRSVDEHTGMPYYKVKVDVTPEGARMVAAHKMDIRAGMPVELFVKTGERTMMSYLMKPILDRAQTSMSED